ncbi:MAG TPA: BON domain-containing protein [Blastocatellia bacterium]|nr:BON domain-containing protein [Blastocatellia bacterium]
MKTIMMVMLSIALAAVAFAQETPKPQAKSKAVKAAPVDCSTATDEAITAGVKEKFAKSASLKSATIEVETKEGVVSLKGMVKTSGQKGAATRMTKSLACVKKVDNQLSVEQPNKPRAKKSD